MATEAQPQETAASVAASVPVNREARPRLWGSLALVVICWLMIFNQQRLEWTVNATYAYGWAVPLLAGLLIWERWRRRPLAYPPLGGAWWLLGPALLLLAYLPLRVIQEANPDWVKINWSMAGLAIGVTMAGFFIAGGVRFSLHFLFPLLFCLTALPWPVWMEEYLVQNLMQNNATISAELLTLGGWPAIAKGNTIQIGSAWVNVEEACSGIRSLQTAFMMSLFFGEYYRLGWFARLGLLVSSFAVAFVLNLARTMTLTYLTGIGGGELMDKWHDTIGMIVMFACLAALWLLAEWFQKRRAAEKPVDAAVLAQRVIPPYPVWFATAGIAWLMASEATTEIWYHTHEKAMPPPVSWHIAWPENLPTYKSNEFPDRTRALMKYSEGKTAAWRTGEGYRWQMYYLRWDPGRVSKFLAASHYPTVCLPATGLRFVAETGRFDVQAGGLTIPFTTYLFDEGGRDVYVFHAILEDRPQGEQRLGDYRMARSMERIHSVLRGERNLGQRVIGVSLVGPYLPTDARDALASMIQELVVTTDSPVKLAHTFKEQP